MPTGYYTVRDVKNETMVVHPKETIQIISTKVKNLPVIAGTVHATLYKRGKKGKKAFASVCFDVAGRPASIETPAHVPLRSGATFLIDTTRGITRFDNQTGHVYIGLVGDRIPDNIEAMMDYEYDAPDDDCRHVCAKHRH